MSKFKVGDKVRIRKDLVEGQYYGNFRVNDSMVSKSGKEVTIMWALDKYYLVTDEAGYAWTNEMFEPIKEKTYPRIMMVSHDAAITWKKRVVIGYKCDSYIAWMNAESFEEAEKVVEVNQWKYAKDIEEPVEMTMEEVCKALGKNIKIIK